MLTLICFLFLIGFAIATFIAFALEATSMIGFIIIVSVVAAIIRAIF